MFGLIVLASQRTAPSACQLAAYGRTRNILATRFDQNLFKKSYNFLECDEMRCDVIIALASLFPLCAGSQLVCSHWTLSIVTIPATDLTKTNESHAKCVRRMTESTDRHVLTWIECWKRLRCRLRQGVARPTQDGSS